MAFVSPDKTIPTQSSTGDDWVQWHRDLKKYFGKKTANTLWLSAWDEREGKKANTRALRQYMERQGVDIDEGGFAKATDKFLNFTDMIGNIMRIGGITAIVVAGFILVVLGIALYNVARNPKAVGEGVGYGAAKALIKK